MSGKISIVATLDTKGEEAAFLKRLIEKKGFEVLIIDIGVFQPQLTPHIESSKVALEGGASLEEIRSSGDESWAMEVMGKGLGKVLMGLAEKGLVDGVLGIGGGMGTFSITMGMRKLPIGFPKVMVSTLKIVQAGLRDYAGCRDIAFIPCPADIFGLNTITRKVLSIAAGAIIGMVEAPKTDEPERKALVPATVLGTTTKCLMNVKKLIEADGYEIVIFHTIGPGGEAYESFILENKVVAALDLSINEVGNELFGGLASAGPARMEAAGRVGIPQVVVPGNADFINFLGPETVPRHLKETHKVHIHNPKATTVRLNREEMEILGKVVAKKLKKAKGKVSFLIPSKGFSVWDAEGGIFFDPEADRAFVESLKKEAEDSFKIREVEAHINDPGFAGEVYREFKELLANP